MKKNKAQSIVADESHCMQIEIMEALLGAEPEASRLSCRQTTSFLLITIVAPAPVSQHSKSAALWLSQSTYSCPKEGQNHSVDTTG